MIDTFIECHFQVMIKPMSNRNRISIHLNESSVVLNEVHPGRYYRLDNGDKCVMRHSGDTSPLPHHSR